MNLLTWKLVLLKYLKLHLMHRLLQEHLLFSLLKYKIIE